ncbi:hypothetical protein HMPREF9554_01202 [Treponema phagedenis F0421]|nr:hypothetical protein HMPREF9554_01202 [Treponema phagedenis F0421]
MLHNEFCPFTFLYGQNSFLFGTTGARARSDFNNGGKLTIGQSVNNLPSLRLRVLKLQF